MHPSLDSTLWRSCEYPFFFSYVALLLCILLTLDLCNAPSFWPGQATKCITEIWEDFEQLWVHLSTDGLLSSREDDPLRLDIRVMLKTSHNDALVLLYLVNPSPMKQDKRDLWQEVLCWQVFLQLSDSLALLYSSECETSNRQAPEMAIIICRGWQKKIIVETFFVPL